MEFSIQKKRKKSAQDIDENTLNQAYKFTSEIQSEMGDIIKAVTLFGSAARKKADVNDIDILVILDDASYNFTPELVRTYKIILNNVTQKINPKIHATTMNFTSFWEYLRVGDPISLNILRDGYPLMDTGIFEPMQQLLSQGRLKPSEEAQWGYFQRAPQNLHKAQMGILQSVLDLYWAVIDSAHATLMSIQEAPPSPAHVADVFEEKIEGTKLIKTGSKTIRKFYGYSKKITSKKITHISGKEYDNLAKEANYFVDQVEQYLKKYS